MLIKKYFFKNIYRIHKVLLFFSILNTLSGCTAMNSKFDCPMTAGVRCESLDQVNARVDRGEIGQDKKIISHAPVNVTAFKTINFKGEKSLDVTSNSSVYSSSSVISISSLRTHDQVMRIWIAPFEDSSQNFHAESVIYTVVKKSRWQVPFNIPSEV